MPAPTPLVCRYFRLRLILSLAAFIGFWVCFSFAFRPRPASSEHSSLDSVFFPAETADHLPAEREEVPPPDSTPVILIDPGHGGEDGGTATTELKEKDWTLRISLALAGELRRRGHRVELTRETDTTVPLESRWQLANSRPFLAVLSVHLNSGPPEASGVETYYSWPRKPQIMAQLHAMQGLPVDSTPFDDSEALAIAIQEKTSTAVASRDRGARNRETLAMTSWPLPPAVLVECAFLTNAGEASLVQDAAWRERLTRGIADGFEEWLHARRPPAGLPILTMPLPDAGAAASSADEEH